MAKKKFFNTKVKSKRKSTIKFIIIGVVLAVILITVLILIFINIQKSPKNNNIKSEIAVEINQTVTDNMLLSNNKVDASKMTFIYPEGFSTSKTGKYEVTIVDGDNTYKSIINVIDTKAPALVLKDVVLNPFRFYTVNDFVESCTDNSNEECIIDFSTDSFDSEGNKIDYSKYMKDGVYTIKVIAKDSSNNETVKEAKLTIGRGQNTPPAEEPVTCSFGNDDYDSETYVLASKVSSNGCALNSALYADATVSKNVNTMLSTETRRIKKDLDALNPDGTVALNRTINVVLNKEKTGMVGYEIQFTITVTRDKKSEVIAEYKLNSDAERLFITNPHGLAN